VVVSRNQITNVLSDLDYQYKYQYHSHRNKTIFKNVLFQEVTTMNYILKIVRKDLGELKNFMKGRVFRKLEPKE